MDEKVFVSLTESGALKVGHGAKAGDKVHVWRVEPIPNGLGVSLHRPFAYEITVSVKDGKESRRFNHVDVSLIPSEYTPKLLPCVMKTPPSRHDPDPTKLVPCLQPAVARLEAGFRGSLSKIVQDLDTATHCAAHAGKLSLANWKRVLRAGDVTGYLHDDGTGTLAVIAWAGQDRGPDIYIKRESFGKDKIVVEINWSASGAMPVADARDFQNAIAQAVVRGALIEQMIDEGRPATEIGEIAKRMITVPSDRS